MCEKHEYCCCCIDLRIGCLILGYMGVFGNIQMFVVFVLFLKGVVRNNDKEANAPIIATSLIVLGFIILCFSFDIILLIGIHKHKRGYVKAHLIFKLTCNVLSIIFMIGSVIAARTMDPDLVKLPFVSFLPGFFIGIYFLQVIRSYYLQMDDDETRPIISHTA